jgi:hypothetical protein
MVYALARTSQLDCRLERSNRNIVNGAADDLGDERASTNFVRTMSSILDEVVDGRRGTTSWAEVIPKREPGKGMRR